MMGGESSVRSFVPLYVVMAMGFFLDGLDGTIVTVALPTIGQNFGMDTSAASWIVTVYFLMMAGLILIFGKLADSGMLRRILVWGFAVFALASLMCGLSSSITMMLVFRAVQGVGSAMLAATAIMLPVKYLPAGRMTMGLTLTLLGSALGAAVGPTLGGVLTNLTSWHWIFFINVPIGLFMAAYSMRAVPADTCSDRMSFDLSGSLLLFVSLVTGLYVLESFPAHGLTGISIISLMIFVIFFASFIVIELRKADPVLDLRLFRMRRFVAVSVAFILVNVVYMGLMYLVPFYLSIEMGLDTMSSGLYMFIPAFVTFALCMFVSKSSETRGCRFYAILGITLAIVTSVLFAVIDPGMSIVFLIVSLISMGLIWGFGSGSFGARLVNNVPRESKGAASSMLSFVVYFGSALGTALYSGLFNLGCPVKDVPISELLPADFLMGFHFVMAAGVFIAATALVLSYAVRGD